MGSKPFVGRRVLVALSDPLYEEFALDGVVGFQPAAVAKRVAAEASHGAGLDFFDLDDVETAGTRAPLEIPVALSKEKISYSALKRL